MNVSMANTTELPETQSPSVSALYLLIPRIQWAVLVVLLPSISVVGFIGNVLSIIVISQDGLRKSSNILLIALAASDTIVLLGNAVDILFSTRLSKALSFSVTMNRFLFYVFVIMNRGLFSLGILCSYSIPMLITVERLCAIFFPLKFHVLITPVRTLVAVLVVVATYTAYAIVFGMSLTLGPPFKFDGKVYMVIQASAFSHANAGLYATLRSIVNEMTGTVPIVVLVLGSVVISYKVKMAARRRAQMMSQGNAEKAKKGASQSRTTKTLLSVCITFTVLSGLSYIYTLVQNKIRKDYIVALLLTRVNTMIFCINCSCNFFIYVLSNNKFRDRLVALFSGKGFNSSKPEKPSVVYSEYKSKAQ